MMTRQQIEEARRQAYEFIDDCNEALGQLNREVEHRSWDPGVQRPDDRSYGSKATGQLRRTSMNLTRTLAKLRKAS